MTETEHAQQIIEKFMPYVYCYMGSGMLSNTYDTDVAFSNAKACALIYVNGIITELKETISYSYFHGWGYYERVKDKIEIL